MDIANYDLVRLDPDEKNIVAFDCGDVDLNDFLLNDAAFDRCTTKIPFHSFL